MKFWIETHRFKGNFQKIIKMLNQINCTEVMAVERHPPPSLRLINDFGNLSAAIT